MNLKVTQNNLYLFLPSKVSRMACILSNEGGGDIKEALRAVYASETYRKLEREETKMWHLGPVALCEEMNEGN